MNDLFGKAILDYQLKNEPCNLITETNISDQDEMSIDYLFRNYEQMPVIEQRALSLASGRVLDAGAGAGSHSLYLQNARGLDVLAVDISARAVETCRLRGVIHAETVDIMQLEHQTFDTILLLMNGTGLSGKLEKLAGFLQKLHSLLFEGGQVLIDSSDIIYMFDEDADGGKWIPSEGYYGELRFTISYKGEQDQFDWLYVDYDTLYRVARQNGFSCELVCEGDHYDYLAMLVKRTV